MKRFLSVTLFLLLFGMVYSQTNYPKDTLICLDDSCSNSVFIGYYIDDDELDFHYYHRVSKYFGIGDPKLQLFDRWGSLVKEISGYEDFFTWVKESYYFIYSYHTADGVVHEHRGYLVKPPGWI